MGFWTALGAIAALVAAAAACFAAVFTYLIMRSARDQVKVSQEQNQRTLESERDAQLPVLMPIAPLYSVGMATDPPTPPQLGYDRTQTFARVAIKNVGPGIALNIWGIVFEPEPTEPSHKLTGQHHSHRYDLPLEPGMMDTSDSKELGNTKRVDWRAAGLAVSGDMEMSDGTAHHKLYAPPKATFADITHGETEKVARLTLTYSDIFGRKHAAIYDLTAQWEWENVAYLRNILQDLGEMERETLRHRSPLASPWASTAMISG